MDVIKLEKGHVGAIYSIRRRGTQSFPGEQADPTF